MNYSVVLLCAGSGKRTGLQYNKMFYKIEDKTVYELSLSHFINDSDCKEIIVVCKNEEKQMFKELYNHKDIKYVEGGKERQDSVFEGLKVVTQNYVMIHDGARPFIDQELLKRLKESVVKNKACLLMIPVVDTIKVIDNNKVVKTLDRKTLMAAQTPQAFETDLIKYAYQYAHDNHIIATDDTSLLEYLHKDVYVVTGSDKNKKITTPQDVTQS